MVTWETVLLKLATHIVPSMPVPMLNGLGMAPSTICAKLESLTNRVRVDVPFRVTGMNQI